MAALREILVAFGVQFDTTPLEKGEKKIGDMIGKLRGFGAALAGALAVDQIKDFVFAVTQQADVLAKQASALGLSVQELQAWQHAAELAGVAGGELAAAMVRLQRGAVETTGPAADALKNLGVVAKDANGNIRSTGDLLSDVAEGMSRVENPAERTAFAVDLFGRAGAKLIPLLKDGAAGVAKLREEVQSLGGGFSDEFARAAEEVNDQVTRLNFAWTSFKVRIVGIVLPAINFLVTKMIAFSKFVNQAQKHTNLLQAALVTLGAFAAGKVAALAAAFAPVLLPLLKIAAIIGVVILLVDDLITAWQGGDSVIGRILDKLFGPGSTKKIVAWTKETGAAFAKFFDDLANNPKEFEKNWAATIKSIRKDIGELGPFWGGVLQVMFDGFVFWTDAVTGGWQNFSDKTAALWDGVKLMFEDAWNGMKFFGLGVIADLQDAVAKLVNSIPSELRTKLGIGAADENNRVRVDLDKINADVLSRVRAEQVLQRIQAPAQGLVSTTVPPIQNVTNVTIPPGTPAQQVRAVAKAAETGGAKGVNRAAKAAITQRGGAKP